MEEDDIKESDQASLAQQERIRLIKEERRRQHEERLGKCALIANADLEDSSTLKRFSKYRRSDRDKSRKDGAAHVVLSSPTKEECAGNSQVAFVTQDLDPFKSPKDVQESFLPSISSEEASFSPSNTGNNAPAYCMSAYPGQTASDVAIPLSTSLSLDQSRGVLKKPIIPPILRSATEPASACNNSDEDSITLKKPSILKKKDDASSVSFASSIPASHAASVSFGLPVSTTVLTRTKSIDSNISGDTETGYWSGGESIGGILKNKRSFLDGDYSDQSSILKARRSSLGSSYVSSASEGGLQSILKRKLSYDSSHVGREAKSNEYSFSTRSLPSCGCLSPEPKPILKKKSSSEDLEEIEPKPILKKGPYRETHDMGLESERIKPCLKKSSSKSTDDGFPSSSSLNFSCGSFSSSVSPVNCISNPDSAASSTSKGILKRGDGKNGWRESCSASTSSSSSDIENMRSYHSMDPENDYTQSGKGNTALDLCAARRYFRSEGDIHSNENSSDYNVPSNLDLVRFRTDEPCQEDKSESKVASGKSSCESDIMLSPEGDVSLCPKGLVNRNSIADKIAALQTNGEIGWKKRIGKLNAQPENVAPTDQNDNVEMRKNNKETSVVANRLSQLEISQETWRKRVGENDANIFTVQGRLEKAGKIKNGDGPNHISAEVKERLQKVVVPLSLRQRKLNKPDDICSPGSPSSEDSSPTSSPKRKQTQAEKRTKQFVRSGTSSSNGSTETTDEEKITRLVHRNDDETFATFFRTLNSNTSLEERPSEIVQIDEASFSALEGNREKLLGIRKNVRAPRNHSSKKNPVKALAQRLDEQTYEELSPALREKQLKKRFPGDNMSKHAHLSVEALAGLASKEDFTAVKLKKAGAEVTTKKEYPSPMLIQIKGKRQVQTRVVAPEVKSLNSGDNFILIASDKVYQFIGEYSNRLERAKIADVLSHIVHKKELGSSASSMSDVVTLEECILSRQLRSGEGEKFLEFLGGGDMPGTGDLGDEADGVYETGVVMTNRVFEFDEKKEELVPLLDSFGWKSQPRFSVLDDEKVLVFDFGSEMYVWSGSRADPDTKKTAHRLATDIFEQGYNFEGLVEEADSPIAGSLKNSARPSWCFIKKINQHMEPILFVEKFFDWPDDSGRLIKVQQQKKTESLMREGSYNFECCDANAMLESVTDIPDPDMELEFFNVGRGTTVRNEEDRRTWTINTISVKAWNMSESSKAELEENHIGQFYSGETYVIRWQFSATQIGRDLKGNKSKHSGILGRERSTYFFWHGKHSKITEQGTSALMTVELDREKGPQIRLEEGKEPPAFLNLFQGLMFVHLDTKDSSLKDTKLYAAAGAMESEGHFVEVPSDTSAFRSLGSYILIDFLKGRLYLWHGCLSNEVTRKIATHGAEKAVQDSVKYLNFHGSLRLIIIEEGDETPPFLCCVKMHTGKDISESLLSLKGSKIEDYSNMKAFNFTSLQGSFEAQPWISLKRKSDSPEAFPMWQEDLYCAPQPQLFLISRGPKSWLWQGWMPRGDAENENTSTGSGEIRWAAERKAALETAVNFSKLIGTQGYLVFAGYEPKEFQNLFPMWEFSDEAREANQTVERTPEIMVEFEEALKVFQKENYTIEELQERPEGVDQSRLESYLTDEDFEKIIKMSREDFSKLQTWRKTEIKKSVGLF